MKKFTIGIEPKKFDGFNSIKDILEEFILLLLKSIGIGLGFGFAFSYITKLFRFIAHNPVSESFMVLLIAFMSYFCAKLADVSEIVAILMTGVTFS